MNKEEQKQLIIDIMDADAKDGLYKQQTAVEWLIEQIESGKIEIVYSNKIHSIKCIPEISKQAKEMEEQQRIDAIKNELKLIGNYFDVSKLETKEQGHHIRFTAILKDRFDYYNETYGGNKQECQFEPDSNLTSATKCKWCGQEKWQHKTYGNNK